MYMILVALLADHPYELYWFNKTIGFNMNDLDVTAVADRISFTGDAVFSFTVEKEYAAGTYEVNAKFGTAVQTSAQNAGSIVERCSGLSDHDKLMAYKDEICRLVEYDADALTDYTSYGKPPYGNPWQMIWVFDGDPSINVVCEGYANAFKYLCDRSEFDSDITYSYDELILNYYDDSEQRSREDDCEVAEGRQSRGLADTIQFEERFQQI